MAPIDCGRVRQLPTWRQLDADGQHRRIDEPHVPQAQRAASAHQNQRKRLICTQCQGSSFLGAPFLQGTTAPNCTCCQSLTLTKVLLVRQHQAAPAAAVLVVAAPGGVCQQAHCGREEQVSRGLVGLVACRSFIPVKQLT